MCSSLFSVSDFKVGPNAKFLHLISRSNKKEKMKKLFKTRVIPCFFYCRPVQIPHPDYKRIPGQSTTTRLGKIKTVKYLVQGTVKKYS